MFTVHNMGWNKNAFALLWLKSHFWTAFPTIGGSGWMVNPKPVQRPLTRPKEASDHRPIQKKRKQWTWTKKRTRKKGPGLRPNQLQQLTKMQNSSDWRKLHGWTAETRGATGDATTSQRTRCRTRTRTVLVDVEKGGGPWETLVQTSITSTTEVLFPPVHLLVNVGLSACLHKTCSTDFHHTWIDDGSPPRSEPFGVHPGKSCITDLSSVFVFPDGVL